MLNSIIGSIQTENTTSCKYGYTYLILYWFYFKLKTRFTQNNPGHVRVISSSVIDTRSWKIPICIYTHICTYDNKCYYFSFCGMCLDGSEHSVCDDNGIWPMGKITHEHIMTFSIDALNFPVSSILPFKVFTRYRIILFWLSPQIQVHLNFPDTRRATRKSYHSYNTIIVTQRWSDNKLNVFRGKYVVTSRPLKKYFTEIYFIIIMHWKLYAQVRVSVQMFPKLKNLFTVKPVHNWPK